MKYQNEEPGLPGTRRESSSITLPNFLLERNTSATSTGTAAPARPKGLSEEAVSPSASPPRGVVLVPGRRHATSQVDGVSRAAFVKTVNSRKRPLEYSSCSLNKTSAATPSAALPPDSPPLSPCTSTSSKAPFSTVSFTESNITTATPSATESDISFSAGYGKFLVDGCPSAKRLNYLEPQARHSSVERASCTPFSLVDDNSSGNRSTTSTPHNGEVVEISAEGTANCKFENVRTISAFTNGQKVSAPTFLPKRHPSVGAHSATGENVSSDGSFDSDESSDVGSTASVTTSDSLVDPEELRKELQGLQDEEATFLACGGYVSIHNASRFSLFPTETQSKAACCGDQFERGKRFFDSNGGGTVGSVPSRTTRKRSLSQFMGHSAPVVTMENDVAVVGTSPPRTSDGVSYGLLSKISPESLSALPCRQHIGQETDDGPVHDHNVDDGSCYCRPPLVDENATPGCVVETTDGEQESMEVLKSSVEKDSLTVPSAEFAFTLSASPNRKKSRTLCARREPMLEHEHILDGFVPEELDPSSLESHPAENDRCLLSGSILASYGSDDDDEHSTMNTLDEGTEDEHDFDELQGLSEASKLEIDRPSRSSLRNEALSLASLEAMPLTDQLRHGGDFVPYFSASTPTASAGYCDSVDGILDGFKPPRDIPEDILSETSSSSSSSSCCSLTQPQLPLKAECRLAHPSAFFQQNVTHLSESVDDGLGSPLVYSALSNGTETQQPSVEEGAECRKVIRSIYGERDFSRCHNLPPLKDNELEFVIENFMALCEDLAAPDRLWSQPKTYQSVSFRVLVFPRGNKSLRLGNVSVYLAVDPSAVFPSRFKSMWYMHHCGYLLMAVHWGNWKERSICKHENFSFSADDVDRGWVDFIPRDALKGLLGPSGQLIIRAQICPRSVVAGSQHFLSRQEVGYIGIRNQGATCYLNSLVQALYHIGAFRKSIFQLTLDSDKAFGLKMADQKAGGELGDDFEKLDHDADDDDDVLWSESEIRQAFEEEDEFSEMSETENVRTVVSRSKMSLALQSLFLKLSSSNEVVTTDDLIRSFGWESNESLTQHDAQELNRLLCDRLEEQMKGTPSEGVIERLFMGEFENYIECIDVPYGSSRRETFYDLQLDVQNTKDIYESLNKYIEEEVLEGDNLYDAEQFGRQRARKGVRFLRFPPVIQFHLKRFTFDPSRMDMVKINQRFEYPQTLDLSRVLPGAGLYDLFCVIVHAGDVGSGHYYVLNRPGGKEWWMRFDDEKVYPVSPYAALHDSYGGKDAMCWDYMKHFDDPHYTPEEMSVKLQSAYILFYVQSDRSQEILEEPDPTTVNPYLLQRRQWEERSRQKQLQIQNYVRNSLKVRYVTETSLRNYTGFLKDINDLPACFEARYARSMTMLELWKTIDNQVAKQEFSDALLADLHEAYYYGLWYFDASVGRAASRVCDVRPIPCHFSDCPKREFTLGDHLSWLARSLRKPWAPTLTLLIHPLFSRRRPEIRSLNTLQNTVNEFRFFIAKFFSPGQSKNLCSNDQSLVIAGLPALRITKDKRHSPLVAFFIELLHTLMDNATTPLFEQQDIEDFVQKAYKMYLPSTATGARVTEDPLRVAERVYLEFGGAFEHLTGTSASILERLESNRYFRIDEWFPPVIVFALPPSVEALQLHSKAELYSVSPSLVDVYDDDTDFLDPSNETRMANTKVAEYTNDNAEFITTPKDLALKPHDSFSDNALKDVGNKALMTSNSALKKGPSTIGSKEPDHILKENDSALEASENVRKDFDSIVRNVGDHVKVKMDREMKEPDNLLPTLNVGSKNSSAEDHGEDCRFFASETFLETRSRQSDGQQSADGACCILDAQAFDGTFATGFLPARRFPPRVPVYPNCTPIDWHSSLTRSKISITLKLYDPLAVLSRWEDASGHPVGLNASLPDLLMGPGAPLASLSSASILDERTVSVGKETQKGRRDSASDHVLQTSAVDPDLGYLLRCPPIKEVKVEVDLRWPYRLALRRLCWFLGVDADYCIVQPVPPLSASEAPAFTTCLSPAEAEYLISLVSWNAGRPNYIATPGSGGTQLRSVLSRLHSFSRVVMKCTGTSLEEHVNRLEDLHAYFVQRQNITRCRDVAYPPDKPFESGVQYHFSVLPRAVTDPVLGFLQPDGKKPAGFCDQDVGERLVLVRVFNAKVENVGCVLVDFNKNQLPTVSRFIEKAKTLFTPAMECRGASKECRYRLVWTTTPYADPIGIQQTNIVVSRLHMLNDQLLASRLTFLSRGFQFGSPLRLEPDFTDAQLRDLSVSESLPAVMSLTEQISAPRALCLTVLHQNRDRQYFGHPFFIIVSSCDTLKTMKEKIQAKLELSDVTFAKWKFFVFDYEHTSFVKDDEVPDFSRGRPACLLAVHRNLYAPEEKSRSLQLHIN